MPENTKYANDEIAIYSTGYSGCHRMTIVGYDDDIWVDINGDDKIQEAEKDLQNAIELEKETKAKEDSILWWAAQIRLDEKIKVLKEILKEVKKDGNGDNV